MCGICGFVEATPGRTAEALEREALSMADTLRHRGPDAVAAFCDPEAGVALGHTRLAVLDPSPAGAQPMRSASGRFVLVYNGEVYDFRELREALVGQGAAFRGDSDTEVLLAALERLGVERTLERVNGMFAFALWDARERELVLARDRMGKKPLYYAFASGGLLFGSELKALRAHPAFRAPVDRDALGFYVQHSYVPAPHTIHAGVHKLPAGSLLRVRVARGAVPAEPRRWWRLEDVFRRGAREGFEGGPGEALRGFEALLEDAVARRMVADVPVGALLSGGIDSTAVVALMQAQSPRPVRTFTIGFEDPRYDESADAARVAAHLGTEHRRLVATPADALALIPRLPELYDEPFGDTSQIPTALVCALARDEVTVALTGDGGDELLAGYDRYFRCLARWRALGPVPRALRGAAARGLAALAPVRGEKAAHALTAGSVRELFVRTNARCPDPRRFVPGARPLDTLFVREDRWPDLADPLLWMMWLDTAQRLPESILVKVDRASMGVGLELRCPLLDHRLVALLARMPTAWKVRQGRRKWLLRRVLARRVPEALTARPKRGFGVPLGDWLRGPLRAWAESLLAPRRLREDGLLDPGAVRAVWHEHLAGRQDRRFLLWNLLCFQAWREATSRGSPGDAVRSGGVGSRVAPRAGR